MTKKKKFVQRTNAVNLTVYSVNGEALNPEAVAKITALVEHQARIYSLLVNTVRT